ncbi:MAG: O-succinylbenzoic acid--CoA ligase [Flavobacteriales bacterium 32-35-8]|nr:MAG: O-succinylbenzoic acid--CoA ligase [Flavobacteriales bacterium 32-35-8]
MIKTPPTFDKVHLKFKLNSGHYTYDDLYDVAYSFIKEGEYYEEVFGHFLMDWLDKKDYITIKTSGSTGKQKTIEVKKQAMVNSAIATGDFFNLKPGNKALHCLPSNYISGKMMLIRAMILGLELDIVNPTSEPVFLKNKKYDFCAMTPMQLRNTLDRTHNIETIIVGGSKVTNSLKEAIVNHPAKIFETYGMTETVSHFALKQLNNFTDDQHNKQQHFKLLPGITISQDDRNCLVVEVPYISPDKIVTNDVVEIHSETEFEWIGRYDNVVNTGGVKVFPEQIENKLAGIIDKRYIIASEPDEVLGEKLILVVEDKTNELDPSVFDGLEKFEKPKVVYNLEKFNETGFGKIQRKKTLALLNL